LSNSRYATPDGPTRTAALTSPRHPARTLPVAQAPLVIYVLERCITRPVMQRVLRELISKALGKDLQLATSTQQFLRLTKRVRAASCAGPRPARSSPNRARAPPARSPPLASAR